MNQDVGNSGPLREMEGSSGAENDNKEGKKSLISLVRSRDAEQEPALVDACSIWELEPMPFTTSLW